MMMNEITCCFTGHRKIAQGKYAELHSRLAEEIDRAYEKGYRRFLCGGALGFDTMCADAVIEKRKKNPDTSLVLVIPCMGQYEQWSAEDKALYDRIYSECDECYCMSELYYDGCMHLRNRAMVDDSSLCIAYLEHENSGTAYTYNYAVENQLTVINLADAISDASKHRTGDESK